MKALTNIPSKQYHYYPFGLVQQGISDNALNIGQSENKKKYNGIERENDLQIEIYDAQLRELDGQIGRWWQVDPKIENMEMWSPYASNYNNPILYSDSLGDEPEGCCGDLGTRLMGLVQGVGGLVEMGIGAAGGIATSWTGLGGVAGAVTVVHGADNTATGLTQLWTGEPIQSLTEKGVSKTLQATGVSEQNANTVAGFANAGIGMVLTAGSAYKSTAVVSTTTKPPTVANAGTKSLKQQADELVKANGGKNSITLRTPTQQIRYDLAGKQHGVALTPHKQIYSKNFVNGVVKSVTRSSKEASSLSQEEIRMIRKYIEKLKK